MKYVISIIVGLAFAIGLAVFLKNDPGLFVFNYAGHTVQMSFAAFVILMLVIVSILYFLISFIFGSYRLPRNYRRWSRHRRYRHSERNLRQGFMHMLEGDWKKAEQAFSKGTTYSDDSMLNYLFAARAAQQQGAMDRRDHYLRLAHEYSPDTTLAVSLTQAELQLDKQQTEQAYATLTLIEAKGNGQTQAKHLLLKVSVELKEWEKVLELLKDMEKQRLLAPEELRAKQLLAYAGLLRDAALLPTKDELNAVWKRTPRKLQQEIHLIEVYVSERLRYPFTSDCEDILRASIKKQWDNALVRLYGLVEGVDITGQISFAEKLLNNHSRDPVLLLTLGRICIRNKLWGKARAYLEECLEVRPNAEAYKELAMLLERQGDHAVAAIYFQEGLNLATGLPGAGDVRLLQNSADYEVLEEK